MRDIRTAWTSYVSAITIDEWSAMERGTEAVSASTAYDVLLRKVIDPKIASEAGAVAHEALLNATVRVGIARSDRLALASDRTNELKWAVVLILGVMTQFSIGLVHLQKRNAHIAALATFSLAAVITLGLIGMQERPFAGEVRIPPTPLQDLLRLPTGG